MKLYIFSLLLIYFADTCSAVYCFNCNSTMGNGCLEQFDYTKHTTAKCNVAEARFCIKTTGVWGAVVGVTRFCSSMDMGNQCQYLPFPDHDRVYRACIFTCEGDGCNPAPASARSSPFLVLTVSLLVMTLLTHWNLDSLSG